MFGMSYNISGQRICLTLLVPVGTMLFYYAVIIKIFGRSKKEIAKRQQSRSELLNRITGLEVLLYYAFSFNMWLFSIAFLIFMPISNIRTYESIIENLEWNRTKDELKMLSKLDSAYGKSRIYSYPKWTIVDSTTKRGKVHTGGKAAYGSFIFGVDNNGKLIYIDSLVIDIE